MSPHPYGFDEAGAPVECEQDVIRLARQLVADVGADAAARQLEAQGVRNRRGEAFGATAVALMAAGFNGRLLPHV